MSVVAGECTHTDRVRSEAKKPAKKRANAGEGTRERARQFKKAHPEIEGVPDKLKKKTMQKLKEKHGIK